MIRLGMLDFDTSHTVEFTRRLNHKGIAEEQWVEGASVVIGCPGESRLAPRRIPGFTKEMEELGVPLLANPTDMIGKVDGMLIVSLEGGVHYDRARPFLEAGIPCFIDKPFTCSGADARRVVELSQRTQTPVFSSSSLRYAPELVAFLDDPNRGRLVGAVCHGPAPGIQARDGPGNPGLFHYGIHALEALYTLMGPGCVRVNGTHNNDVDVVVGQWQGGRVATLRGIRAGKPDYGFLAFTDREVKHVGLDTEYLYRELLKRVVTFFREKKAPVDVAVTVEMMAFMEAALKSAANHGVGEKLAV